MIGLNEKLAQIDKLQKSLRIVSDELTERIGGGAMETAQKVSEAGVQARIAGSELKENIVNVKILQYSLKIIKSQNYNKKSIA